MMKNNDMKKYYIDVDREKRNTAGAKAPADVSRICEMNGFTAIKMPAFPTGKGRAFELAWMMAVCTRTWLKLLVKVKPGDVVLYQHPMYGNRVTEKMIPLIQNKKKCKFIALIHDLEALRGGIKGIVEKDENTNRLADYVLLKRFDAVICHNAHMKQHLIEKGFCQERLVSLELFDYLSECKAAVLIKGKQPSLAIAGNLAIEKSGYIYKIVSEEKKQNLGMQVNLFGVRFEESAASGNLIFRGSFLPEELPQYLMGDFGLVWDGTSEKCCEGNTGEYLRYNNPHKTSLYLSAGYPVIVWKQAAVADFVLQNKVGLAVESLEHVEEIIAGVTEEQYNEMCSAARSIAERLHRGYYTMSAIEKAISIVTGQGEG